MFLKQSNYQIVLISLLGFSALLRFYNLGWNSLWLDEASTLAFASQSLTGIWESTAGGEFNPPLFYWFEHGMLVFGESEFVLRFIPALLGTLTIPVVYFIGKEFQGQNVGVIAAALLTFSPFHIYYSQEARAYAPMLFFFSLALHFYLKASRSNEIRSWALFGIFSAIAFWTHFYVAVPIAILILHALVTSAGRIRSDPGSAKNLGFAIIAFVVASLPLLIVAVSLFFARTSSAPAFGVQGLDVIYQTLYQISGFSDLILIIFTLLFLLGVIYTWNRDRNGALLLIFMMALPLAASIILSSRMPMVPRYLIYLLPIYFIGIASSYTALSTLVQDKRGVYVVIAIIFLISVPFFTTYYTTPQKNDWRGFSADLGAITEKDDIIVVLPPYITKPLDYYYSNTTDGTLKFGANTGADLDSIRDQYPDRRVYYIVTWDILAVDPTGDALIWLDENTEFAGQHMGIHLFKSA